MNAVMSEYGVACAMSGKLGLALSAFDFLHSHVQSRSQSQTAMAIKTLRQHFGDVFRCLEQQKDCRIEEGNLMVDHVHMMISIPPKHPVSRWWGTSRARVRSTWRGCIQRGRETLQGSTSGREATLSRP